MSITYAAGTGTIISSPIVFETIGDQSAAGSDEIILSDTGGALPSDHNNFALEVGDGTSGQGPGDVYSGRLIVVRPGESDEELKYITSETGAGPVTLTVHEPWGIPPASGDYVAVSYTMDDIETGGESGGVAYTSKTAAFVFSNKLSIGTTGTFAMLQLSPAESMEINDSAGATDPDLEIFIGGMFCAGYLFSGQAVGGGYITSDQNSDGEYTWATYSGSYCRLYDTDLKINLNDITLQFEAGSDNIVQTMKNFQFTYDCDLQSGSYTNVKWYGHSNTNDLVRITEDTTIDTWVLYQCGGFTTLSADTSTESLTIRDVVFIDNTYNLVINSNKSWYVINPSWTITTYNDALLNWTTTTANYVYDQRSVDAVVQESDGDKLEDALVIVYEASQDDLVQELTTNVAGEANGAFTYLLHSTNSSTTTYSGHALRVDKWDYTPFVATQASDEYFDGVVVLSPDNNISAPTQSGALATGSGIVWNEDTYPSSIIEYENGTGSLSEGDYVLGGTSSASGTVTAIIDGDSTAGVIHLKDRNAIDYTGTEALSNGSGWNATLVSSSQQDFSIWIEGDSLNLTQIYDYFAALTSEIPLSATGELVHEWGRDQQGRVLYYTGSAFYTLRSYIKGVIIVHYGAGTLSFFTDDDGGTYTPPTSLTITVHVQDGDLNDIQNAQTAIYNTANREEIMNKDTDVNGDATVAYTGTPINIEIRVRKSSPGDTRYIPFSTLGSIGTSDYSLTVTLQEDTNA